MHRVYRLFAIVEILAVPVAAQLTRGFISGTITDSSGAVMSHVNINVTEGSTGVRHTDLSNEAGRDGPFSADAHGARTRRLLGRVLERRL